MSAWAARRKEINKPSRLELIEYIDIFNTSKKFPTNYTVEGFRQEEQIRDELRRSNGSRVYSAERV